MGNDGPDQDRMTPPAQRKQTNDESRAIGAPDFTRPIELMMDCHRRIEHFLKMLQQVASHFSADHLDDDGRQALETGLNYFQRAAPRHTTDEERSLFPRLRQCADPDLCVTLAELDRLENDHRRVEVLHHQIEELGHRWLQAGRLDTFDAGRFQSLLGELAAAYHDHIRVEDERVFVAAARVLTAEELRVVGAEMEQRRVVDPGRAGSRCAERRRSRTEQR